MAPVAAASSRASVSACERSGVASVQPVTPSVGRRRAEPGQIPGMAPAGPDPAQALGQPVVHPPQPPGRAAGRIALDAGPDFAVEHRGQPLQPSSTPRGRRCDAARGVGDRRPPGRGHHDQGRRRPTGDSPRPGSTRRRAGLPRPRRGQRGGRRHHEPGAVPPAPTGPRPRWPGCEGDDRGGPAPPRRRGRPAHPRPVPEAGPVRPPRSGRPLSEGRYRGGRSEPGVLPARSGPVPAGPMGLRSGPGRHAGSGYGRDTLPGCSTP